MIGLDVVGHEGAEVGYGLQQLSRVGVSRRVEHLDRLAGLDDVAPLHHDDAVGEVGDDTHVVGDQEDAGVDAVTQVADELEDLRLHGDVERRRRLVGDEHGGIARQGLGDHRPLPLATGELVRVGVDPARAGSGISTSSSSSIARSRAIFGDIAWWLRSISAIWNPIV